ncbi:unnamed protein product [Caenorhabditis bovis]|nr:unnamed protein product [Caenorhabditis bovis]
MVQQATQHPAIPLEVVVGRNNELMVRDDSQLMAIKQEPNTRRKRQNTAAAPVVEDGQHVIKRIKSEIIVKKEIADNSPMPVSVPCNADLPRMGPATPATPSFGNNPLSTGSIQNLLCSPRQTVMVGDQRPSSLTAPGSAPYTPASVGSLEKSADLLACVETKDLIGFQQFAIIDSEAKLRQYLYGTKDVTFEDVDTKQLLFPEETHQQQTVSSTTVNSITQFTPPWEGAKN